MNGVFAFFSFSLNDWSFSTLLGIALLQLFILILLAVLFWRRGADKNTTPQPGNNQEEQSQNGDDPRNEPSGLEIYKDLSFLRQHLGNRIRHTPVFLALGAPLPESLLSVFSPHGGTLLQGTQLDMYLYDRGVLISPRKNFAEHASLDPTGYDALFRELLRMRPQRALDGVVLSLSVETMRHSRQTEHTATRLNEQLARLQRITGINCPVQVLVYDSEKLTGFQEFGNGLITFRLPKFGEQTADFANILSWASPYDSETPWDARWLRDAQRTFCDNVCRASVHLFAGESGRDSESSRRQFLLADELETLTPNLELFCNVIFSRSVYHERFLFRSLSFCGTVYTETTPQFLFADRMLRENLPTDSVLAVPPQRFLYARRRNVRIIQTLIISMLVFWSFGMLWALPYLKLDVQTMERFGRVIEIIKFHNDDIERRKESGEHTKVVRSPLRSDVLECIFLETNPSGYDNLRSVFFPTSYLSKVPTNVSRWQEKLYQRLIRDTIPLELEEKALLLYETSPANAPALSAPADIFLTPLEISEFTDLQNHIDQSAEFCSKVRQYGAFLKSGDAASFLELLNYIYGTSFSVGYLRESRSELESMLHRLTHRGRVSVEKTPEEIRFERLQARITDLMERRFVELASIFDEKLYQENHLHLHLSWVCERLNGPPSFTATFLVGDRLDLFYQALQRTMLALRNPELNWILKDAPLFSDENLPLRTQIREETFLDNRSIEQWDRRAAELKARQFQALRSLKYNEQGELFTFLDERTLTPQPWLEKLDLLLQRLQREEFMKPVEKTFLPDFAGNILSIEWNVQALHDAVIFSGRYETIFNEMMPERFELIQIRAGEQLIDNMHSLVTDGVRIRRSRSGGTIFGNFPEARDKILQILAVYDSFGTHAKRQRQELETLAGSQALAMLADFDRQFERDALYQPQRRTLERWDGNNSILVPLLGIPSEGALEHYLQMSLMRLTHWQSQIAPLLVFLEQRNDFPITPEDLIRIKRWQGICQGLDLYAENSLANPVSALEQFIRLELPNPQRKALSPSPNWFYQRMYELDRAIRTNRTEYEEQHFHAQWKRAAEFFNTNIQGRFPFVSGNYASAPPASPDAIRHFYQLLPEMPNEFTQQDAANIPLDYHRFYASMMEIKSLFFGQTQGPNMLPDLMLSVEFRLPDPTESGAQRLLDQSLRLGLTEISLRNGAESGVWQFGTPTRFTLHWAKDGGVVPQAPANPNARLSGNTLVYEYNMPWSLLVFLYENAHIALEQDALGTNRLDNRIGFDIPTVPSGANSVRGQDADRLRTFLRIRLYKAGEGENMEIILPRQFPDWMPVVGESRRFEIGHENQTPPISALAPPPVSSPAIFETRIPPPSRAVQTVSEAPTLSAPFRTAPVPIPKRVSLSPNALHYR
ncbi:MAG: type VI secretion system protein [Planctomycetaceae bacterium]|nr:type VI secretion system protein [Planctomycetaceae bacterium]